MTNDLLKVIIAIVFLGLVYLVMRGVTKRRRDRYKDRKFFKRDR